jgi:predicted XRE-type DNA-binding protein
MRIGPRKSPRAISNIEADVEQGSGNVFADLDYPDAAEALVKSRLAQRIAEILDRRKLTQKRAAEILSIDQPKVSKLIRGQLKDFSTDRLLRFLNSLNQDVEIVIREKPPSKRRPVLRVVPA